MRHDPEAPPKPIDPAILRAQAVRRLARNLRRRGVDLAKNASDEDVLAAATAAVWADPRELIAINELQRFIARKKAGLPADPEGMMPDSGLAAAALE